MFFLESLSFYENTSFECWFVKQSHEQNDDKTRARIYELFET